MLSLALDRQKKYEKSEISAKVKYEKKINSSLKYASKPFFSYFYKESKRLCDCLEERRWLRDSGGGETAEEFSFFFSCVFTTKSFGPLEEHFGVLDVKKELSKVNPLLFYNNL